MRFPVASEGTAALCRYYSPPQVSCRISIILEFHWKLIYIFLFDVYNLHLLIVIFKLMSLSHRQTNWHQSRGLFSIGGGGSAKEQPTLEDIAKKVRERRCKRVLVMAGAGISTPSGIPDFR